MHLPDNAISGRSYQIQGIVQGVGFRPFVYQLAARIGLAGTVANTHQGVEIFVQGTPDQLGDFEEGLSTELPPLASIAVMEMCVQSPRDDLTTFSILPSGSSGKATALITPDTATCRDCLAELADPSDRRYGYPFINCTNCGPRYTLINGLPYDRSRTTMSVFSMCKQCTAEYTNPENRRFHAQPNACPVCGPAIWLDNDPDHPDGSPPEAVLSEARNRLKKGEILAVKGLGGFHLAVDATNDAAVIRLRNRKHRYAKPLAIMSVSLEAAEAIVNLSPADRALLLSREAPIVLAPKHPGHPIARSVAPDTGDFGVMVPYTPLHSLLLDDSIPYLVMTSANPSSEPICGSNAEAVVKLSGIADSFLFHNREIENRCDDSVLRSTSGGPLMIRRSRGFAPAPVFLRSTVAPVLGCGAELKNTFCLTRENRAFLSPHIGDLENVETLHHFESTRARMTRLLDITPQAIAHDLHPDYLSTRYALQQTELPAISCQHHHAHIVSCMAENRFTDPVIGLALDGTGLGTDGHIWGGEVLIADTRSFERYDHLEYLSLPGGDQAAREPWRMAASCLYHVYGENCRDLLLPPLAGKDSATLRLLFQMIDQQINSPLTSSAGRLFDAVSALLGICERSAFEGQAAMALESACTGETNVYYQNPISICKEQKKLLVKPLISAIVEDIVSDTPTRQIASRFHGTLAHMFTVVCESIRDDTGLRHVALSGGVFQNRRFLSELTELLLKADFTVLRHHLVPPNDGGISLGQAVIAGTTLSSSRI